jgi:hypothetical protein
MSWVPSQDCLYLWWPTCFHGVLGRDEWLEYERDSSFRIINTFLWPFSQDIMSPSSLFWLFCKLTPELFFWTMMSSLTISLWACLPLQGLYSDIVTHSLLKYKEGFLSSYAISWPSISFLRDFILRSLSRGYESTVCVSSDNNRRSMFAYFPFPNTFQNLNALYSVVCFGTTDHCLATYHISFSLWSSLFFVTKGIQPKRTESQCLLW